MIPSSTTSLEKKPLPLLTRQLPNAKLKIVREKGRIQAYVKREGITYEAKPLKTINGQTLNGYLQKKDIEIAIKKFQDSSFRFEEECVLVKPETKQIDLSPLLKTISDKKERSFIRDVLERLFENDPEDIDFDLSNSNIGDEGAIVLAQALETNQTVKFLYLDENPIGNKGAIAFAKALEKNQVLEELELGWYRITDFGIQALKQIEIHLKRNVIQNTLEIFSKADPLESALNLSHKKITDEDIAILAKAIEVNKSIQVLNLQHNRIGNKGAKILLNILTKNKCLQRLYFSGNLIDNDKLLDQIEDHLERNRKLFEVFLGLNQLLENNPEITHLNLSMKGVTNREAIMLAKALEENEYLQELNLSKNQIETAGAQALLKALETNQTIQVLNLSQNQIRNTEATAFLHSLEKNLTLHELFLSQNPIRDIKLLEEIETYLERNRKRFKQIAFDGLTKNDLTQTKLRLIHKGINDTEAIELAKALQRNTTLRTLTLDKNQIGNKGALALMDTLEKNVILQNLSLNRNPIQDNTILNQIEIYLNRNRRILPYFSYLNLHKFFENDQTQRELFLHYKKIGIEEAKALASILRTNPFLQKIKLSNDQIDDMVVTVLIHALEENQTLQQLGLQSNQIGNMGALRLAQAIEKNPRLPIQQLDLSRNQIGNMGAQALAHAIEKNQRIQELYLLHNPIGDVGVEALEEAYKANRSLQILHISSNKIGKRGKSAIRRINRYQAITPLLTEISVEEEKELVRKAVWKLLRDDPEQTRLDLSNKKISDEGARALAKALERNVTLNTLNLENNPIGDMGVKTLRKAYETNKNLQFLYISSNKIGEQGKKTIERIQKYQQIKPFIDAISPDEERKAFRKVAWKLLKNDPQKPLLNIDELNSCFWFINDEGVKALAKALEANEFVQELDFNGNQIGFEGILAIAQTIEKNPQLPLQTLNLWENEIGDAGTQVLMKALAKNRTLQYLDLSANQIGFEAAQAIAQTIENNPQLPLQQLNLSRNKIGNAGTQVLMGALAKHRTLQYLNLSDNQIGFEAAQAIAQTIEKNPQLPLQTLDLCKNEIGDAGTQVLMGALAKHRTLQYLNLSDNQIGIKGAQAIAQAIERNPQLPLQELNLSNNQIGEPGALARAIEKNPQLQRLNLSDNQIEERGAKLLLKALDTNQILLQLDLRNNRIGNVGKTALMKAIETNQVCRMISEISENRIIRTAMEILQSSSAMKTTANLRKKEIGDLEAQVIARIIEKNHVLERLDLSKNHIGNASTQALAQMIEKNHTLQQLNLSQNQFNDAGFQTLATALENNTSLLQLQLTPLYGTPPIIKKINMLTKANNNIATTFLKQTQSIQKALKQPNPTLLAKQVKEGEITSKKIIPYLETIALQSGRKGLNQAHKEKLQTTIDHLTHSLQKTLLNQFEDALALLSKKYFEERTTEAQRNLGNALYKTWANFFYSQCPNWLQTKTEEFTTLRLLLDIAEGNTAPYNLQEEAPNIKTLFHRLLAFKS